MLWSVIMIRLTTAILPFLCICNGLTKGEQSKKKPLIAAFAEYPPWIDPKPGGVFYDMLQIVSQKLELELQYKEEEKFGDVYKKVVVNTVCAGFNKSVGTGCIIR